MGFSEDLSGLFIEMLKAINERVMMDTLRTKDNTTDTAFEEFAEIFVRMLAA